MINNDFKRIRSYLKTLRNFYRQYETEESKKRIKALRDICYDLREAGEKVTFFVGGSLSFGMSEKSSDIELIYVGKIPKHTPIKMLRDRIQERVEDKLGYKVPIDLVNTCDIQRVKEQLNNPEESVSELNKIYKLDKINAYYIYGIHKNRRSKNKISQY